MTRFYVANESGSLVCGPFIYKEYAQQVADDYSDSWFWGNCHVVERDIALTFIEPTLVKSKVISIKDIEKILKRWNVRYSREYNYIRVFGTYDGYSIVRFNSDDNKNPIELDGRICSISEFEDWIYRNCK